MELHFSSTSLSNTSKASKKQVEPKRNAKNAKKDESKITKEGVISDKDIALAYFRNTEGENIFNFTKTF